jgi:hypothetical protein
MNAPLSKRAWAFQEHFLAPRVLQFTAEQIFCECRARVCSETRQEGLPRLILQADVSLPRFSGRLVVLDPEGWSELWAEIVRFYSQAQLTYARDKLAALSGISGDFQAITRDQYCVGLWRSKLMHQLC